MFLVKAAIFSVLFPNIIHLNPQKTLNYIIIQYRKAEILRMANLSVGQPLEL